MHNPPPEDLHPTAASAGDAFSETSLASTRAAGIEAAGAVIGRYHLLQMIGEGGMGEVWLAEQKQPVRRRVALKLIKAGMDTRELVGPIRVRTPGLGLDGSSGNRQSL